MSQICIMRDWSLNQSQYSVSWNWRCKVLKIAYFDCFSGASGDMILGALLACGVDLTSLNKGLDKLGLGGFELAVNEVIKKSIRSTQVDVVIDEAARDESRRLSKIKSLIVSSRLSEKVKAEALRIFQRLGEAEATVHGVSVEDVHFHEVGAVDSIVDIVGSAIGLDILGIDKIICGPMNVGGGFVKTAHGILPAPAPATLELIKGLPFYSSGMHGELLTPTGAAILSTLSSEFGNAPQMEMASVGYGAGKMDLETPNVLRLIIGTSEETTETESPERVAVIETNIDDMSPQLYEFVFQKALSEGALDVSLTTIQMKKNRPGVQLQIICPVSALSSLADLIFRETTSIGLRWRIENRMVTKRVIKHVETEFGVSRVKVASWNGRIVNISPEYEDCRTLAAQRNVSVKRVITAASLAASKLLTEG